MNVPLKRADRRDAASELHARVDELLPLVEQRVGEPERQGYLTDDVVAALRESGVYWMLFPKEVGGPELSPFEAMTIVERLSYAHPSVGWCALVNNMEGTTMAIYIGEKGVDNIFGKGPDITIAGNGVPRGFARPVDGGYMIRGKWAYGSAIQHAEWIHSGCFLTDPSGKDMVIKPNGQPKIVITHHPRASIKLLGNWDVLGLRATGSFDYTLAEGEELFVPMECTYDFDVEAPLRGSAQGALGPRRLQRLGPHQLGDRCRPPDAGRTGQGHSPAPRSVRSVGRECELQVPVRAERGEVPRRACAGLQNLARRVGDLLERRAAVARPDDDDQAHAPVCPRRGLGGLDLRAQGGARRLAAQHDHAMLLSRHPFRHAAHPDGRPDRRGMRARVAGSPEAGSEMVRVRRGGMNMNAPPATSPAIARDGFERMRLNINGTDIVVLSIGNGRPLVFLHGTGTFTGFEVARQWAAHHRVLIRFHPGFGESGDHGTLDTIEDYALHYMDLFDRLELDGFDLAGFSLGGWMAAEFAIRQPRRVRRLVLVAPAGLVVNEAPAPDLFRSSRRNFRAISLTIRRQYCVTSPRRRTLASMPLWAARSVAWRNSFGTIRRAIPSSRAGFTALPCRRWCCGVRAGSPAADGTGAGLDAAPAQREARTRARHRPSRVRGDAAGWPHRHRLSCRLIRHLFHEGQGTMIDMPAGVTPAAEGFDGVVWNILGQTYTLKQHSEDSLAWHALFPAGTFVPPHIHPTQDEFIYVLAGRLQSLARRQGLHRRRRKTSSRMPKGVPHGIFNKSGADATSLFWVSPTRSLKTLFDRIQNMADPAEVIRIAAGHEVNFLPPPA